MATAFPDFFAALAAPFASHEVKVRSQAGRQLHYITARTAMIRLDEVAGPECWWDEYIPGANSVMCKLTVVLPDGRAVTKMDAGGYAGMADQGDDDKSGFSDAFKRAAAKFGVARYLYRDGIANLTGDHGDPAPDSATVAPRQNSATSRAPEPSGDRSDHRPADPPRNGNGNGQAGGDSPFGRLPTFGRALFPWCKEMEGKYGVGLIKYLDNWAKLQGFSSNQFKEWTDEEVKLAVEEAVRKLKSIDPGAAATEDAHLATQRENLRNAIRGLLADRGVTQPTKAQAANVLNELSGTELVGGEVLHAIDDCSDSALLGRYIAACDNLRHMEANV